ncbi:hypothetical protein DL95DRAFT_320562 [Leptodontidium sp. 2 PMI_412]|nr:hypothetical protein DL95DRAFT_320562 [Leptodontidium sp. 2 PMI_412]
MRFSVAALFFCSALANAAALPAPAPQAPNANIPPSQSSSFSGKKGSDGKLIAEPAPEGQDTQALQRRAGPIVVVAGIAATAGAVILTKIAIEIGAETIANLGKWNEAREEFTKTTTQEMWNRNPDYTKFPAAACYNKGYRLSDPAGIDGLRSAKLELGLLSTDYDCMYIAGPNQFFTDSEGGFINLSYTYNPDRCSFDDNTGDLTCS